MRSTCGLIVIALAVLVAPFMARAERHTVVDLADPVGDDTGNGHYVYPTDKAFEGGGMADLTGLKMEYDEKNIIFTITFRKLVDPWKVGNRLSFIAIAIDNAPGGFDEVGHLANAKLKEPAEFIVYGGGNVVEVQDLRGPAPKKMKELGGACVGDTTTNIMTITVPLEPFGVPKSGWNLAIMSGLQEDYGAGGMGDFREVLAKPAQWRGGGGDDLAIDPNIYDLILPAGAEQVKILSDYSITDGKFVTIPSVKIP